MPKHLVPTALIAVSMLAANPALARETQVVVDGIDREVELIAYADETLAETRGVMANLTPKEKPKTLFFARLHENDLRQPVLMIGATS